MQILIFLLFTYLFLMFLLIQLKGDTSIANFTWGGGVLLVTLYTFFVFGLNLSRQILITTVIFFWALRIIIYIYIRYTGKDPRFKNWKWQGVKGLIINFSWVFGQIVMIGIMSFPAVVVNISANPALKFIDIIGLIIWITGFVFESVSDYQLLIFMRNPNNKGHVMSSGLWHYSRHPNYFGEVLMWWGVYLIALSVPYGWATVIAPITITFLLLFVTGVPMLENAMQDNPEYQEYKQKTSVFIPWFAKK